MNSTSNSPVSLRRWLSFLLLLLMLFGLSACHAQTPGTDAVKKKARMGTPITLTLEGYNYTNRYIDQFSVDGQGGGNLFVSGPTSGGGGSICCVGYVSGAEAWKAKVRWQIGACTYNERTDGRQKFNDIHSFFKEVEVQVDPNIPDFPRYFEVHFYPDGHVEAAITEHASPPRLVLAKEREDRTHYPQCPNDKEPEK